MLYTSRAVLLTQIVCQEFIDEKNFAIAVAATTFIAIAPLTHAQVAPRQTTVSPNKTDAKNFNAALDAPLIAAVKTGNAREVGKLLGRKADPNAREANTEATTALGLAAPLGNVEIVKMLIAAGGDLENGNSLKQTPLLLATLHDRSEAISALVQGGAKIDSTQYNMTALMLATTYGYTDSMRTLLRLGADVNARDANTPRTALVYGVSNFLKKTNLEMIQLLVEAGANLFVTPEGEPDVLAIAKQHDLNDVANYLASKQNLEIDLYNAGLSASGTSKSKNPSPTP